MPWLISAPTNDCRSLTYGSATHSAPHPLSQSMTPLLDRFYVALKALSREGLAACVAEGFVLDWQGTEAIPWAGRWYGVQGLLDFVDKLNAEIEILEVERLHVLETADVTVVVLRGKWRSKRTNREVRATAANLFTFSEGLVSSYTVLNNTAAFAEALQGT